MSVPIPPTLAPYAVQRSKQVVNAAPPLFISFVVLLATEMAIGISISVVEVLEIHIESIADVIKNPNARRRGDVPTVVKVASAIRRWRPEHSTAFARKNPPSNSKIR